MKRKLKNEAKDRTTRTLTKQIGSQNRSCASIGSEITSCASKLSAYPAPCMAPVL